MSVDTFSGLTSELDQWYFFGREEKIQRIKARADVLIKERFDMQIELSAQALNEEAKFYRLLCTKMDRPKTISFTAMVQTEERNQKLNQCAIEAKELLDRYVYQGDLAAVTDAGALKERVTVLQEDAGASHSSAIDLLHGLGKEIISSPSQYIKHRQAVRDIYWESKKQIDCAQGILNRIRPGHFYSEQDKWSAIQKNAPRGPEGLFIKTYDFVAHPMTWIATASERPGIALAASGAMIAGIYLFPFAACSLIGGSLLLGGILSRGRKNPDLVEEPN